MNKEKLLNKTNATINYIESYDILSPADKKALKALKELKDRLERQKDKNDNKIS